MRTSVEDTVLCAMYSSQKDAITAQLAIDVFSTWIIIVLGSITVLDFGTANTSCFC
jgi:hypothetical protein